MASSHQVAFIALPAGFCKAKWKAQIQMRTDAVSCLSVAPRGSPIVFRDSAVNLRSLAADIANATGRTAQTSHSGQFAVIWDEAQCECSRFAAAPWGTPCAQMFQIKLLGSATEHVPITCVNGYSEGKHCSHILMREFFKAVCKHPAYILGGCFGINAFSISKYTEGYARSRKWKRVPLLLKNAFTIWPDPAVIIDCPDACVTEAERTPHCTCIALACSPTSAQLEAEIKH